MAKSTFVYVTYIRTTPERLWSALTSDSEFMKQYWFGMHSESAFIAGSSWKLVDDQGHVWDAGEIVEADPPRRLVVRWEHQMRDEFKAEGPSLFTMELVPNGRAVRLMITHCVQRQGSKLVEAVSNGWPKILSNLKSLLETGAVAFEEPRDAMRVGHHAH